jgi:hypothetical protein
MRSFVGFLSIVMALLAMVRLAPAQSPNPVYEPPPPLPGGAAPGGLPGDGLRGTPGDAEVEPARVGRPVAAEQSPPPVPSFPLPTNRRQLSPAGQAPADEQELEQLRQQVALLRNQQAAGQAAPQDEQLKKQLELQQKQIEVLEKQIKLLREQVSKAPPAGAAVEKLETDTATLQARSLQAAHRDQEAAAAIDSINDHIDSQERYGPQLPWTLKQLFDPFDNNETPLSIYGALTFGYQRIIGNAATAANGAGRPSTPGGFYFGEFTPDFLLKLNDWIFLEAEIGIGGDGSVSAGSFAQADFFVNDWLTIIAGRFVAPIGWYNERLNNPWVNKLPTDAPGSPPLLWLQVLPPLSLLGVEAQGAFYLGCSPIKLEYNAYISNGLNFTPAAKSGFPDVNELANLENMTSTFSVITNDKAVGGRVGLWWPEVGLAGGISGMLNGDYVAGGFEDSISLWALDLNYHHGNWDARAEYGETWQEAGSFAHSNIRRRGCYAQVAYRPWDCPNRYLQNVEFIYRYSYVDFRGIDPKALDLTTFSTPIDVPVRRSQHEVGIDYWFYRRMVLKVAYQFNEEPGFHLHDNQFITELAWGW